MTNQNDALIAEAVGYWFWRYTGVGTSNGHILCRPPNPEPPQNQKRYFERAYIGEFDPDVVFDEKPLPFITKPTHETDGIVREFVRENLTEREMSKFNDAFGSIVNNRLGITDSVSGTYIHIYSRPGDYAQALLATLEEKRDG